MRSRGLSWAVPLELGRLVSPAPVPLQGGLPRLQARLLWGLAHRQEEVVEPAHLRSMIRSNLLKPLEKYGCPVWLISDIFLLHCCLKIASCAVVLALCFFDRYFWGVCGVGFKYNQKCFDLSSGLKRYNCNPEGLAQ